MLWREPEIEGEPGLTSGELLGVLRWQGAGTRDELAARAGVSRAVIIRSLAPLISSGLAREVLGRSAPTGRPPSRVTFDPAAATVLVARIGRRRVDVALTDLVGAALIQQAFRVPEGAAATAVLSRIVRLHLRQLDVVGRPLADALGVGIAIPVPASGPSLRRSSDPRLLVGWLAARYRVPVIVDHHANVMTIGEAWTEPLDVGCVVYLTTGEVTRAGVMVDGRIHHGSTGLAGRIGHTRVVGREDVVCRCGARGCLDAVAGSRRLLQKLAAAGADVSSAADVVALANAGHAEAIGGIREAGAALGAVLSECVRFLDPSRIVIDGVLAGAPEYLLPAIRNALDEHCPTSRARITVARGGPRAGVSGAATMVIEDLLAPGNVDRAADIDAPLLDAVRQVRLASSSALNVAVS